MADTTTVPICTECRCCHGCRVLPKDYNCGFGLHAQFQEKRLTHRRYCALCFSHARISQGWLPENFIPEYFAFPPEDFGGKPFRWNAAAERLPRKRNRRRGGAGAGGGGGVGKA